MEQSINTGTEAHLEQNITANTPNNQNLASFNYNEPTPDVTTAQQIIRSDTAFDFESFKGSLSAAQSGPTTQRTALKDSFTLPTNLTFPIVTPSANTPPKRDGTQQALYTYGNAAGSILRTYEETNHDASATINNYFKARTDPTKAAELQRLGGDMSKVGTDLKQMTDLPSSVKIAHEALADAFVAMGNNLIALQSAQSDEDIIASVEVYNSAVSNYLKQFIAIAQTFPMYTVTFDNDDPGSVFMFTNTFGI
jgi:hypothetical protein